MIYSDPACRSHEIPIEFVGDDIRPYPETKLRLDEIIKVLADNMLELTPPKKFERKWTEEVHAEDYITFIENITLDTIPIAPTIIKTAGEIRNTSSFHAKLGHYFYDPATPIMGGTPIAAKSAVNLSLSAGNALLNGRSRTYALSRPPGHHARYNQGGGYCIFNNVVIAANYLATRGKAVSILDLDYHHGNGTQELLYNRDDIQYVSLHADPTVNYPFYWGWKDQQGEGIGKGYTKNHPLKSNCSINQYFEELDQAIHEIHDFNPEIILLSMGFDCHINDPIAGMNLTTSSYRTIGEKLQSFSKVGTILEGGYDLGSIGNNFLELYRGLEN